MGDISATHIGFEGKKVRVFTGSSCCLLLSVRQQVSDKILGGGKRSQVLISSWRWVLCYHVDSRVLRVWPGNFLTDSILVVNSLTLTKLVLTATFSLLVNKYSHIASHLGLEPALYELFFQYAIPLCLSNIFRATEVETELQAKIRSCDC